MSSFIKCPLCCHSKFHDRSLLRHHLMHISIQLNNLQCSLCSQGFITLQDYIEHLKLECLDDFGNPITRENHVTYVDCGAFAKDKPVCITVQSVEKNEAEKINHVKISSTSNAAALVTVPVKTLKTQGSVDNSIATSSNNIKKASRRPKTYKKKAAGTSKKTITLMTKDGSDPPSFIQVTVKNAPVRGVTENSKADTRSMAKVVKEVNQLTLRGLCAKKVIEVSNPEDMEAAELLVSEQTEGNPEKESSPLPPDDDSCHGHEEWSMEDSENEAEKVEVNKISPKITARRKKTEKRFPIILYPKLPTDAAAEKAMKQNTAWQWNKDKSGPHITVCPTSHLAATKDSSVTIFQCPDCSKMFDQKSHYDAHPCKVPGKHTCKGHPPVNTVPVAANSIQEAPSSVTEATSDSGKKKVDDKNTDQSYQCPDCRELFSLKSEYDLHICNKNCDLCVDQKAVKFVKEMTVGTLKDVRTFGINPLDVVFKCPCCNDMYKYKFEYDKHLCNMECDDCGQKFQSIRSKMCHKRIHQRVVIEQELNKIKVTDSDTFHCVLCNDGISVLLKDVHQKIHNEGLKVFKCSQCLNIYLTKSNLILHEKQSHDKLYKCLHCLSVFKSSETLKAHNKIHIGSRKFICSHCDKEFNRSGDLYKHERVHTGEKPNICEVCGKCFRVSSSLLLHMRTHTNERPYSCKICPKTFKGYSALAFHISTHGDARPHKCPYCTKCFKTINALHGHRNSHNKPFKCEFCDRSFGARYSMVKHLARLHQGEGNKNKFDCVVCGASYGRAWSLEMHLKTHGKLGVGVASSPEVLKKMVAMGSVVVEKSLAKPKVRDLTAPKRSSRPRKKKVAVDV